MYQVHPQWEAVLCGSKGDGEEQARSQDLLQTNTTPSWVKRAVKWLSVDQLRQSFSAPGRSGLAAREWLIASGSSGHGPHLTPGASYPN